MNPRNLLIAILATLLLAACGGHTGTDAGAGIQGTPVRLAADAAPGSTHALRVLVVDTGNGTETMTVRAVQLSHRPGWLPVPDAWISAATVTLAAGHSATVTLQLAIPAGARAGKYRTAIEALSGTGWSRRKRLFRRARRWRGYRADLPGDRSCPVTGYAITAGVIIAGAAWLRWAVRPVLMAYELGRKVEAVGRRRR